MATSLERERNVCFLVEPFLALAVEGESNNLTQAVMGMMMDEG